MNTNKIRNGMNTTAHHIVPIGRCVCFALMAVVFITACSNDDSSGVSNNQESAKNTPPINNPVPVPPVQQRLAPEACEPGQSSFVTGYQNFPGMQCSQIAEKYEKVNSNHRGFRKQCKIETAAKKVPKFVARIQMAECIPLSGASRGIGKRALWDSLVR